MQREPGGHMELDEVATRLGSRLRTAEPVGWGDTRATHRLSLIDGRSFAARRFAGPEPRARVERIGRLMARLAEMGLPVPSPIIVETARVRWLLTSWVDGETGAGWLDDPDRVSHLAERMGRLARRLRAVDLDDVDLRDDPPAGGRDAAVAAPTVFVHGDFVPANVVVDTRGEIVALLDFEHAGTGPALLDVAWWGWVVRHHHPEAWKVAWPTFLRAAGVPRGRVEARLHGIALRSLADRAAAADDAATRRRWLDRLARAQGWTVPGGQAT